MAGLLTYPEGLHADNSQADIQGPRQGAQFEISADFGRPSDATHRFVAPISQKSECLTSILLAPIRC